MDHWSKENLQDFCRENGFAVSKKKKEMVELIEELVQPRRLLKVHFESGVVEGMVNDILSPE